MIPQSSRRTYVCQRCGAVFRSYNPTPKYCSRSCKISSQTHEIDTNVVARLYQSGWTQDEIAAHLGVTQKVIHNTMKRNGIQTRVAAKRDQWGVKNHMWKGDGASYSAFHIRLWKRYKGDPQCEVCGTDREDVWYDWANLTGNYHDMDDYTLMCRSCHRQYDAQRRKEVMPNDAEENQTP